jgi:hypothetical protein
MEGYLPVVYMTDKAYMINLGHNILPFIITKEVAFESADKERPMMVAFQSIQQLQMGIFLVVAFDLSYTIIELDYGKEVLQNVVDIHFSAIWD